MKFALEMVIVSIGIFHAYRLGYKRGYGEALLMKIDKVIRVKKED